MAVESLPGYRPSNPFDGDSRSREGPAYRAAGLEARRATVDWQVTFQTGPPAATVENALVQDWPVTVSVSQVVTGKGGSGTRRDSRSATVRVS